MVELSFVTVDVFTQQRYIGNQLAIVHIPKDLESSITQAQKQSIAKEFNLSETVFVYESDTGNEKEVRISIFTLAQELPFAGHPTVGTGFHLLHDSLSTGDQNQKRTTTLVTLAGKIPVTYDPSQGLTRLQVPHNITRHATPLSPSLAASVIGLDENSYANDIIPNHPDGKGVALVSVVKGLAFALIRVTSLEVLKQVRPTGRNPSAKDIGIDDGPGIDTFLAFYVYYIDGEKREETTQIRTRMVFDGNQEDPATGSAASCLAGFLSIVAKENNRGDEVGSIDKYEITQGVEIGRKSDITVEVQAKKDEVGVARVEKMWLSGRAVHVMKGTLTV